MKNTPFHDYVKAGKLLSYKTLTDFTPIFAATNMKIFPYQIAAAQFVLHSKNSKGALLCDEGSLGKTYEALLVAAQKFYHGYGRQMLILPVNLLFQWQEILEHVMPFPYYIWDGRRALSEEDGLIVTTYQHALKNHKKISQIMWDFVIFEEANILSKPKNKITNILKAAFQDAFKLLLTPTPITMSIMDIYGLIYFIDDSVLPDANYFYKRYFRKPENYHELSRWVSQFAFRTLKKQVTNYVNFPQRFAFTLVYSLSAKEKEIYDKLATYLALPYKQAYPKMDLYDLTLLLYHILASSSKALNQTIFKALMRIENFLEKTYLLELQNLIENCQDNNKLRDLRLLLQQQFAKTEKLKYAKKALIFVNNKITMNLLAKSLRDDGYFTITSRENDYARKFRTVKNGILIANGDAAKGLNLQFCALVINYDLLYNAIDLEQRINRCHRQGQTHDVTVVNFVCKENIADVRALELINKRTWQFDRIFGRSDNILGDFVNHVEEINPPLRACQKIEKDYDVNLILHQKENEEIISEAQEQLFTSFTKKVADNITITPQYTKEKTDEINNLIWDVVTSWFRKEPDYRIDEKTKTIQRQGNKARKLFYYDSGGRYKPYIGKPLYGIAKDFKPISGRLSLLSPVVKGILSNIKCSSKGILEVDKKIQSCEIGFYYIDALNESVYRLVGQDDKRKLLSHKECEDILSMQSKIWHQEGNISALFVRNITYPVENHILDELIKEDFFNNKDNQINKKLKEKIENICSEYAKKRVNLEREIALILRQMKECETAREENFKDNLLSLRRQKDKAQIKINLKNKKAIIYNKLNFNRISQERDIKKLKETYDKKTSFHRHFILKVKGKNE